MFYYIRCWTGYDTGGREKSDSSVLFENLYAPVAQLVEHLAFDQCWIICWFKSNLGINIVCNGESKGL